ncbi:MAG TPA: hypothetical protein VEJ45_03890 [Candidatus Acidoferrales bacterium]|nr:hypothetical protein [Candidatus Acidoferrales bacterium]
MRHVVLLLGAILIFALNAHAQTTMNDSPAELSPVQPSAATVTPIGTAMLALATAPPPFPNPLGASSGGSPQVPTVQGVFPDYYWRIYAGYSFFRFYISSKPSVTVNTNGLDFGIVYYPHVGWIGVEGQFVGEYGGLFDQGLKFGLGLGGVRFRWSAPRQAEVWGHALVGGTRFSPQTAFGGQGAFAFEAGAGVDLGSHRKRWAIRGEADLVGTRYFSTYQYSPRFAGGVVFKY